MDGGAIGGNNPLENWYFEVPKVTRTYATAIVGLTVASHLKLVSPFQLYYNYDLVVYQSQYWRLLTNFLYFGSLGLDFIFHMFFVVRYSRMLEEEAYRNRTADFLFIYLFGATMMLLIGPAFGMYFLGSSLSFMIVYLWSRNNAHIHMSFFGFLNFTAPYLPFVLMGFSFLINNRFPAGDLLGISVGHVFYFFDKVYPSISGRHVLSTPRILKAIFDREQVVAEVDDTPPTHFPGGYGWGNGNNEAPDDPLAPQNQE